MPRDRLMELREKAKHPPPEEEPTEDVPLKKKEPKKGEQGETLEEFLDGFEEVVESIDKVKDNTERIRKLQSKILNSPIKDAQAEGEMDDLIAENKKLSVKIRNRIKLEEKKLEKVKEKKLKMQEVTELRLKRTQIQTHSKRFFDVWTVYNNGQVTYREKSKKLFVKRVKVANIALSEDQIEDMLDEGNVEVFAKGILDEERLERQKLTELQDRHDQFIKLEKSIKEVHDMFIEIAALVENQGEMVDNIAAHVHAAEADVERGKGHLQSAEGYAVSARKKKLCLIGFGIIVLLIVLLVILSEFGAFSGGGDDPKVVERVVYVTVTPSTTTTSTSTTTMVPLTSATSGVDETAVNENEIADVLTEKPIKVVDN